jgi:hypothetical protein
VLAVGSVVVGIGVGGMALDGLGADDEVVGGAFVVGPFDGLYVNYSSESGSIYTAYAKTKKQ